MYVVLQSLLLVRLTAAQFHELMRFVIDGLVSRPIGFPGRTIGYFASRAPTVSATW